MQATSGVKGLVARAQRAAQKRGQKPSTAHLLLIMLQQGGELASLLRAQGVRESDLLNALRVVDEEALSTLDRALERTQKFARSFGHSPSNWHLLLAITRDARSAGHRSLAKMGTGPGKLHDEVLVRLEQASPNVERHVQRKSNGRSANEQPARRPVLRVGPMGAKKRPLPTPRAPLRTVTPLRQKRRKPLPRRTSARRGVIPHYIPNRTGAHEIRVEKLVSETPTPAHLVQPTLDEERFPTLCKIGTDLSARARAGLIDPVIGRDREIETLLDVLARRRSNNPILVGPPGVGKTAIVEGLALRLSQSDGPLSDRIVIEMSAGSLVSGTGVRGALSKRIRALREEVALAEGRVLLFIDETHAIISPDAGGPDDLASELKAGLARGELPCIGATTNREYRKYFEKDPALARRFSPIQVNEPSVEDAITILRGIAPRYAEHHGITVEDEAIEAAVRLSVRFLPDSHLPDKAIGVLDLAGARVRRRGGTSLDRRAIASVIAERAGVPEERLLMRDGERLLKLESLLSEKVVGHTEAISTIAGALRKSAAGFRGKRPLGTFLFLGPTGVGKTEMAKAISEVFFPGTAMTRFDMSELGEKHAVARLFGAPPGYIGHDEGGELTTAVRGRPYQLILLDEIEKAHPDVLLSLLPLLDEGRISDGKGRSADATNTIIVMTSNLGAAASERRGIGFGESTAGQPADRALEALRRALPPELFNRIDEPLFFGALSRDDMREIARRMLGGVNVAMGERELTIHWDDSVIETLIDGGGFEPSLGARPMRRTVGRLVEAPLAEAILRGDWDRGVVLDARGESGKIMFEKRICVSKTS